MGARRVTPDFDPTLPAPGTGAWREGDHVRVGSGTRARSSRAPSRGTVPKAADRPDGAVSRPGSSLPPRLAAVGMVSEGSRPQTRERPPTRERAEAALADALAEAEAAGLVVAKSEEEAAEEEAAAAAEAVEAEAAAAAAATNEAAAAAQEAAAAAGLEAEAEAEAEVEAEVETAAVAAEKAEKAARRAMDGHVLLDEDLMRLRRAVRTSRPLRISPTFNPRPWSSDAGDGTSPGSPGPRIGVAEAEEAEEAEGAFGAARATLRRASEGNAAGNATLAHSRAEEAQAQEGAWSGDWEAQDALALAAAAEAAAAEAAAAEAAAAEATAGGGGDADVARLAAGVAAEEAARPATATRPLTSTSSRPATATGVGRCDEAQSRDTSRGPAAGSGGVFGGFSPILPAERSSGCEWRSGDWPAASPAASRAFPKVASGQRRPLSSRARAGRADGASLVPSQASLIPTRGAAEGAVGLMGSSPPAARAQFAVDYQPKLSTTRPKHMMGFSLLAGGGAAWSDGATRWCLPRRWLRSAPGPFRDAPGGSGRHGAPQDRRLGPLPPPPPPPRLGCTKHPPPQLSIASTSRTAFDHPGGARSIRPLSPPGGEPAAAEGRQRRGRASVSPLFGAAGPAAHEFSACGTAVVIAGRGSPAETPPGGDAPPAAPALDGSDAPL